MPRKYKTKGGAKKRESIDKERMRRAVYEVVYLNKSLRGTAKLHKLSVMTLKRYVRKKTQADEQGGESPQYEPDYRNRQIFTVDEENELEAYIVTASKLHHGLTPKTTRKLAYQFAKVSNKTIPVTWQKYEIATYEWYQGFMDRHQSLSLRKPEATSLSRATSFNKHNVAMFYDKLASLMTRFKFEPKDIYSMDETGVTTVHVPDKIVAQKGTKQVSKVTSGERGVLVTICAAINATGNSIPPFFIFPRKNWQERMLANAPPGSGGAANPSGWMDTGNFVINLKHFQKNVKSSKDNPTLIIFDNHESHISIEAINYAREHGIHLLTIPPHTSHKMQPLDRIPFTVFKHFYNSACDDWMLAHPGRPITIYDVAGIVAKSFPQAMTPVNIVKSFQICGIYPFDRHIFTEDEFMSSYVTDRPEEPNTDVEENEDNHDITTDKPFVSVDTGNVDREQVSSPTIIHEDDFMIWQPPLDENTAQAAIPQSCPTLHNLALSAIGTNLDSTASVTCALTANMTVLTSTLSGAKSSSFSSNMTASSSAVTAPATKTRDSSATMTASSSAVTAPATKTRDSSATMTASSSAVSAPATKTRDSSATMTASSSAVSAPATKTRDSSATMTASSFAVSTPAQQSLETIRPHPKAEPRKTVRKGRKKGSTKILTDTPEKQIIEEETRKKEEKKRQQFAKAAKKKICSEESKGKKRKGDKNTGKQKKKPKPKRKKRNDGETSSDEDIPLPESPLSEYNVEEEYEIENSDSEESSPGCDNSEDNIREGDWVVVNLVSQKSMLHRYVGQVVNESLSSLDVKFAKKINDKKFKWPEKPDCSVIGKYQVMKKLPAPNFKSFSKRVGTFEFPKSLRRLEIDK